MSRKSKAEQTGGNGVIVIHPSLNGEAHAIAEVTRSENVTTVYLPDAAALEGARLASPTQRAIQRETAPPKLDRAVGLDAYRGFFLLAMTFAMTIPHRAGLFPEWMYHMQSPPGIGFIDRAGLTWRDLLYPGFLFTMCTAIPITNTLRLNKGMAYPEIIWTAVKRFALLYVYALVIGHVLTSYTNDYTKRANVIGIIGFLSLWPVFMRKPASWDEKKFKHFKMIGWIAVAGVLFALPLTYGARFSLERHDPIIQSLAFVSLATTTLWLFTRTRPAIRLAAFAFVFAVKLAEDYKLGFGNLWYNLELSPALVDGWMFELLLIGIPGTFAGDALVKWMRAKTDSDAIRWSSARMITIAAVCFSFIPVGITGFYLRQIHETMLAVTALSFAGLYLTSNANTIREKVISDLFRGAALLLIAGSILEPVGGGIKKDPQTLSYLIFSSGIAMAFLIIAVLAVDASRIGHRASKLFVAVGQNPLIAYIAFMMFFNNIGWLTPFGGYQSRGVPNAIIGGLVYTALVAALTAYTTKKKIFWRA